MRVILPVVRNRSLQSRPQIDRRLPAEIALDEGEIAVIIADVDGLALDREGNVYLSACLHGRRGLVRITPNGEATLALAGTNLVGLAFSPLGTTILATSEAVYDVDLGVEGLNLF